jgi:Cytochrome P460
MRRSHWSLGAGALIVGLVSAVAVIRAEDQRHAAFPEDYRTWRHVKTLVVGPESPNFAKRGGFHHYYANDLAAAGYRTGKFPNGSVIVDEAVFTKDGEGPAKGLLLESGMRFLDVMVKDDVLYKETGGWSYEHFDGGEKVSRLTPDEQKNCNECHARADHDHVFSRIRP